MDADRVLARTTAVLSRIDDALDDPFPAAVARLPGCPAGWWSCHIGEVVTVGQLHNNFLWARTPGSDHRDSDACWSTGNAYGDPSGCWADTSLDEPCDCVPASDLGLCAAHHAEIVGVTPEAIQVLGVDLTPLAEALAPVFSWWRMLDDDTRDGLVSDLIGEAEPLAKVVGS